MTRAPLVFAVTLALAGLALAQGVHAADADPVAECDRLAGNPRDPQRVGPGVERTDMDGEAAVAPCRAAVEAASGSARLQYQLGRALDYAGRIEEAAQWYRRAADAGSAVARTALGNMYEWGDGVPQDDAQAVALYRSAMPDDPWSFASLAYLTEQGRGVPQDYAEAMRLYRQGAEAGDAWANVKIGELYEHGNGVPADPAEAMRWYRKALDAGEPLAYYNLGNLYAEGIGVPVDVAEAERLWQLGIDRDVWQAKNALAYSWAEHDRNLDAALKLVDEALSAQPKSIDAIDTRGWILYRLGRLDEAAAELERALAMEPEEPAVILDHLGDVEAARGKADKAQAAWEAALKAESDTPRADSIRKKLRTNTP
jgi:uncharacterized protein